MISACGGGEPEQKYAVTRTYESGGAVVTIKVDRTEISVADSVEVVLEALVPEGVDLTFPPKEAKLGEFTFVRSSSAVPQLLEGDRVLVRHTLELEPFLPGDYEIPSLEIKVGEETSIKTEPVSVTVASVLPGDAEEADIKDIAPPVSLPGLVPWVWAALAAALVAAIGGYLWWRRRKKFETEEAPPPPHEVALKAMRELMKEGLIEKGEAKLFYLRISAILRHYIEDRFGLHAPERTTEEFLHDLQRDGRLNEAQKALLREFLMHCDIVKFAEYQPERAEIEETINTCAQFIAETKLAQSEAPVAGGGET